MSAAWPTVALGEVIDHRKEFIIIDDLETYRRPRVQLHAQGIVLRDAVSGAQIKTKKQQVARAGEFLVAEIDAKVGGFGIVPDHLNGAIVSSHYFLYGHKPDRLDNKYLGWFVKTRAFRQQVEAQGSTNYAAIRPDDVLGYEIPLPTLDEQRRIVDRIEELSAKVQEAQRLRQLLVRETQQFSASAISQIVSSRTSRYVKVSEIIDDSSLRNGKSIKSVPAETGIRCLTLGALRDGRIDTENSKPVPMHSNDARPYLVAKNDVFIVRGNGSKELCGRAGMVLGDTYETIFPDLFIRVSLPRNLVDPRFFVAVWNSREMRSWIEEEAKTTSGIWKINQGHILAARIPLPPVTEQERIVGEFDLLQNQVDKVKALQSETATELVAMLPSILDKAFKGEL